LGAECHVVEANNGAQAFDLALKHPPAFSCASAKLGVFNRDRMAAKLCQTANLGGLRIIAIDAGMDDSIAKPVQIAELKAALESCSKSLSLSLSKRNAVGARSWYFALQVVAPTREPACSAAFPKRSSAPNCAFDFLRIGSVAETFSPVFPDSETSAF
jgi:hypothetical protein